MNMLNPTAIPNPKKYGPDDIAGLFLRRFRKQVQEQMGQSMLPRDTQRYSTPASDAEERAYALLADTSFVSFDKAKRAG